MILNIFNEGRHAQDSELVRVFLRMKKLSQIKPPLLSRCLEELEKQVTFSKNQSKKFFTENHFQPKN